VSKARRNCRPANGAAGVIAMTTSCVVAAIQ
jgi:hypothetical protein